MIEGLAEGWQVIGIEDLNVHGMSANRHLARAMDGSFHEFPKALRGGELSEPAGHGPLFPTCPDPARWATLA